MKTTAYIVKTTSLSVLLLIESFFLTLYITEYVAQQNYFSVGWPLFIRSVSLMTAMLVTYSLTVGGWGKWEQYLIVPAPISIALFLAVMQYNLNYAIITFIVSFLILCYDIYSTTKFMKLLIKFDPKMIFKMSATGLLFLFSILGGFLVILHSSIPGNEYNVGQKVTQILGEPIRNILHGQLQGFLQQQGNLTNIDPAYQSLLEQAGYSPQSLNLSTTLSESLLDSSNLNRFVESQVNNFIAPYRNFVKPVIALLVFGLFQFFATVSLIVFKLIIDLIFSFAKNYGFFNVEYIVVKKEELRF